MSTTSSQSSQGQRSSSSKGLRRRSQSLTENSSKSISESVSKKTLQRKSSKGGEILEIVVDDIVEPLKKKPNSKECCPCLSVCSP